MGYETEHGVRFTARPSNLVPAGLLQDAAPPRELVEVAPWRVTAWGNAMRLEIDHQLEIDRLHAEAWRAHDPRLVIS